MKKSIKIISVIALAVCLCLSFTACGDSKKDSAESNVLKVGMECGYAPFNWTQIDDSNGAVAINGGDYAGGYDVEIAKRIAEGLGMELQIVKTNWDGLPQSLEAGTIDAIIAGMSPTAERKEVIDFTDNYYTSDLVIVVKKGSQYAKATSIQDFSGAKVCGQLNTFHDSVIDQINGVSHQTPMDDFPAMRVALESGVIDGYVSERPEAVSASAANDNFTFVEFAEGKGFTTNPDDTAIAIGIKKGREELLEKINKVLAGISEEDRLKIMDDAIANQPAAE